MFFIRGGCNAEHNRIGEEIEIRRRGGKFEVSAGVILLLGRAGESALVLEDDSGG